MTQPKPDRKPPTMPPDQPQPKKPVGDPPNTKPPKVVQPPVAIGKPQVTLEPGENGRSTGPAHTEPLVKNAPQRDRVGPGTYGNDQFAAEHHDDVVQDRALPEGLQDPQGGVMRPTTKPKEDRYGRIGGEGKG